MNPRPRSWKEARRLQAWHLKQQGWPQRQIAEALGVSAGAVSQWMTRARQGGAAALRARPSPGAPRRLTPEQLARLSTLLDRGPETYGFRGQIWTRNRVAEVMRREWGVVYHHTHVGRLLRGIRWSPQKPMRRARQRDEAAKTLALYARISNSTLSGRDQLHEHPELYSGRVTFLICKGQSPQF